MAAKPAKSAWATQVDDEEESGTAGLAPLPAAFGAAEPEAAFPSLGDAAKVVETKADRKKKQQKMTLADFNRWGNGSFEMQLRILLLTTAASLLRGARAPMAPVARASELMTQPRDEGIMSALRGWNDMLIGWTQGRMPAGICGANSCQQMHALP